MASTESELLQNLCEICQLVKPKYKCPACSMRTCSAACSKRHKEQTSCTGTVDPTKFLKREELVGSIHNFNRDYNFLQRVGRQIHVAVNDLEDKLPKNKRRGPGMRQNKFKKRKQDNGKDYIVRSGVKIHQLPDGMSRAANNKTGWIGKKDNYFGWTIDWVIWKDAATSTVKVGHAVPEESILEEVVKKRVLQNDDTSDLPIRYFLSKVPAPANKPALIELDGKITLKNNLNEKTVIEYPVIHILLFIKKRKAIVATIAAAAMIAAATIAAATIAAATMTTRKMIIKREKILPTKSITKASLMMIVQMTNLPKKAAQSRTDVQKISTLT